MRQKRTIFTVGYQGYKKLFLLITCLREHHISLLVDIRRYPHANTFDNNPWCTRNLEPGLTEAGIGYEQLKSVAPSRRLLQDEKYGVPADECMCRSAVQCYKNKIHNRRKLSLNEFRIRYLGEIQESNGIVQLEHLFSENAGKSIVLMCAEADVNECHRKMLADAFLEIRGEEFHVSHL